MNDSYTRRHVTRIQDVVSEDGELLDRQEIGVDILIKGQTDFYFTFAKHFGTILQLDGNEIKVVLWCAMNANLNTNEIVLNRTIKARMAATAGISIRSIDNALTRLCKRNLIHRIGTGVYHINPEATWRGKISAKDKNVRLFVNYTIED